MNLHFFIKGLIIGLSIAAPVGPIGLLCIQRTIAYGKASGLLTGLGAATADGFYGAIAAFGLTVVSDFLVEQQFWFRSIGGAFLLCLGIKTFMPKHSEKSATGKHKGLFSDYLSTVFLTLANPATILSFMAIFAGLGLGSSNGKTLSAAFMVAGVISGSALWWLLLSGGVSLLKTRFNAHSLAVVDKISGCVLLLFALLAFASIFKNIG